jgi:hypothetical protein
MAEDEGFILSILGNSPFLGKRVIKGKLSFLGEEKRVLRSN